MPWARSQGREDLNTSQGGSSSPEGPFSDDFETQAVDRLPFPEEHNFDVTQFTEKSLERAILRLRARKANLVFNDSRLEGSPFTEPEVVTLIEGGDIDGADDFEVNRVLAISEATDRMIEMVSTGRFSMSKSTSDQLHSLVGEFESLDAGRFRGEGAVSSGGGAVNALGEHFRGPAPGVGGERLRTIYADGLERLSQYGHPAVRGTAYATFATYNRSTSTPIGVRPG